MRLSIAERCDEIIEWITARLSVVILASIVLLAIGVCWLVAASMSPSFTLQKDEWTCTKSHDEIVTRIMSTGKSVVPYQAAESVCDVYQRRR